MHFPTVGQHVGTSLLAIVIIDSLLHKGVCNNNLLIIYSPPCHSRYPRLSFFSRKEMKVFEVKDFHWEPNGSLIIIKMDNIMEKLTALQKDMDCFGDQRP